MDWIANEDAKNILSFLRDVAFLGETWNKKARLSSISEDEHSFLHSSFCDGDKRRSSQCAGRRQLAVLGGRARVYGERPRIARARTLNLPYCFCDGARALELAVMDASADHVNDIEVGDVRLEGRRRRGRVALRQQPQYYHPAERLERMGKSYPAASAVRRAREGCSTRLATAPSKCSSVRCRPRPTRRATRSRLARFYICRRASGTVSCRRAIRSPCRSIFVIGHLTAARWLSEALHATLGSLNIPRQVVGPSNSSILVAAAAAEAAVAPTLAA